MDKPPFTIAVVNSKGGVGKTTSAVALAALLGRDVGNTTLLDLDRQGTASAWLAEAEASISARLQAVPADTPPARLARLIADAGRGSDWLVIDTPPGDLDRSDAAVEAVTASGGIVIVPTGDSPLDLPRTAVTLEDVGDRAKALVLLTQTRARTRSARQARQDLESFGAIVLTAEVPLRESVKGASSLGLTDLLEIYEPVAVEILGIAA